MSALVVLYGKFVDHKTEGVFLEGVYFGGVANSATEANKIAESCTSSGRGGTIFPRIMPLDEETKFQAAFEDARQRFTKLEREMIENEDLYHLQAARKK